MNENRNILLKIMGVILIIQGVLQLLSVAMILMSDLDAYKQQVPISVFYISAALMALYGAAAVLGGYAGFRKNLNLEGRKRAFYYGIALLVINVGMILTNVICHTFKIDQMTSFLIPGVFTCAAFLDIRKK